MDTRERGWYSYAWIDNAGTPSATTIVSELQDLHEGAVMLTGPGGGFTVKAIEPERTLLLEIHERGVHITSVFSLVPQGAGTRLLIRLRARFFGWLFSGVYRWLFEVGDFVMMRKQMLGIRERAEGRLRASPNVA